MIEDESLFEEFVIESNEHLETIEEDFLTLENQGAEADSELVNKVFRAVHSIKGGSGFLGLEVIQHLAHVMENLLDQMRDGKVVPDAENMSVLLEGADRLKAMLGDYGASNEENVDDLCVRLTELMEGATSSAGAAKPAARRPNAPAAEDGSVPLLVDDDGEPAELQVEHAETWFERPSEHVSVYQLRYDLHEVEQRTGRSPLGLIEDLSVTGTILNSAIASEHMDLRADPLEEQHLFCLILYATLFDHSLISAAVDLPDEAITHLRPSKQPLPQATAAEEVTPATEEETEPAAADRDENAQAKQPDEPKTGKKAGKGSEESSKQKQVVRVNLDLLDQLMTLAGELVLVRNRHLQTLGREYDENLHRTLVQQLNGVTNELQEAAMRTRMQPVGSAFAKLPRMVRDLSRKLGKHIDLQTSGNEVEIDKTILESLADPLTHLIRNACDHGIEMPARREEAGKHSHGTVDVNARHEGGQIVIEIIDDGGGIPPDKVKAKALEKDLKTAEELERMSDREAFSLILLPGFSTADEISDVSGRGVGMDVVRSKLEEMGGSLEVDSHPGQGSTFTLRLPLTLAIIPGLACRVGEQRFVLPQVAIEEVVRLYADETDTRPEIANNQPVYRLRDRLLPLVFLSDLLANRQPFDEDIKRSIATRLKASDPPESLTFAVAKVGDQRFGLVLDEILGNEDIVVKPMHPALTIPCLAGSTVLGDGAIALILDATGIYHHARIQIDSSIKVQTEEEDHREDFAQLFFTLGGSERFALPLPLIRRIITFPAADLETVAGKRYARIDDQSIRLIQIDQHIPVDPASGEHIHLIFPRHLNRPVAIIAQDIIDVGSDYTDPDPDAYSSPAVSGATVVDNHTTLFLDLYRLAEMEEPTWFKSDHERVHRLKSDGHRVLLLEDTPFFMRVVTGYLQEAGFIVEQAENGAIGMQKLAEHDFDLVVCDIEMPVMNGYEFARQVRSKAQYRELPMMALTALSREEDRDTALRSGFDEYEMKIDRGRFLGAIDVMLNNSGGSPRRTSSRSAITS